MSTKVTNCNTKHLVEYDIKSEKHLKKLNGKYYKLNPDDMELKLVNSKKDKHLIGKKIYARSAATCALGDYVCPTCVGATASTNYDIADKVRSVCPYSNIWKNNYINCWKVLRA